MVKQAQAPAEKHSAPQGETAGGDKQHGEKPRSHQHVPQAPTKQSKAKVEGMCGATGCKSHEKRFGFCDEHYDQFKFGLIKKTGEQVSDYEKKFEHYQAHRQRQAGVRKAA